MSYKKCEAVRPTDPLSSEWYFSGVSYTSPVSSASARMLRQLCKPRSPVNGLKGGMLRFEFGFDLCACFTSDR